MKNQLHLDYVSPDLINCFPVCRAALFTMRRLELCRRKHYGIGTFAPGIIGIIASASLSYDEVSFRS